MYNVFIKHKQVWTTVLVGLLCFSFEISAQTITGSVYDATNNESLIGVSVKEDGTNNGTVSDVNGNFTLKVSKTPTKLTLSYVGFETKTVDADAGRPLKIGMAAGSLLEEVVVTAFGIERAKKTLTYSAQTVTGDQVNTVRDGNFLNTLSGKVAGASITTSASGPGGASRIVLRGNRSLGAGNDALMVIDGVIIDNSKYSQVGNDFGGYSGNDGAANINPDDIESMTVLKGSNASALYGAEAANGVIIITTKKGKAGKISTEINSGFTSDAAFILPSFQNEYAQGAGGNYGAKAGGSWGPTIAGLGPQTDWLGRTNQTISAQPDNVRNFFVNGTSLNNSVGITGGSDKLNTYMSYTNNRVNGIVPENYMDRHTFNLRVGSQLTKRLSADGKITYVNQGIFNRVKSGEEGSIVLDALLMPRTVNVDDVKDNYDKLDASGTPYYWTSSSIYQNPYWLANKTSVNDRRNRITAFGLLKYQLTDWLSIQGRVSQDRYTDQVEQIFSDKTLLWAQGGGSYNQNYNNFAIRNMDVLLSGKNNLSNNFSLNYNLGAVRDRRNYNYTFLNAAGLLVPNRFDPRFGKAVNGGTGTEPIERQSVYGTAQLGFKDYLFLDVTGRQDWVSTLPAPHSLFFPSFGLTGVISDMVSMPDWITFGKARISYAETGNGNVGFDQLVTGFNLSAGGTGGFIFREGTLKNPDLQPELTKSLELGLDWRFFHNRLGVDLTFYKTNTRNQVLSVSLPLPTGYNNRVINAGNIENQGVELQLTARPIEGRKFNWTSNVNFARNISKVIELFPGDDVKFATIGGAYSRSAELRAVPSGGYGDLYAQRWANTVVTKDGNTTYTYTDGGGKYLVDDNGKPIVTSVVEKIGNINPRFNLGWNNSFDYGNWSLGVLVDGRFGGVIVSGTDANNAFYGNADYTTKNRDSWVVDAKTTSGAQNDKAIKAEDFWTTVSGGRYSWGEFFAYDATNVRIRELTLGYNFKIKSDYIKGLRVSFVGRNLAMLYRGSSLLDIQGIGKRKMPFDPDVSLGASNFQGIEYGNIPSTRSLGVNVKLSF